MIEKQDHKIENLDAQVKQNTEMILELQKKLQDVALGKVAAPTNSVAIIMPNNGEASHQSLVTVGKTVTDPSDPSLSREPSLQRAASKTAMEELAHDWL